MPDDVRPEKPSPQPKPAQPIQSVPVPEQKPAMRWIVGKDIEERMHDRSTQSPNEE